MGALTVPRSPLSHQGRLLQAGLGAGPVCPGEAGPAPAPAWEAAGWLPDCSLGKSRAPSAAAQLGKTKGGFYAPHTAIGSGLMVSLPRGPSGEGRIPAGATLRGTPSVDGAAADGPQQCCMRVGRCENSQKQPPHPVPCARKWGFLTLPRPWR